MKAYESILKAISRLVEWITCSLLVVLVLIISWQVFARYVMGKPPSWSEEIAIILVVWFGLLGAGLGVRDKSHLAVEFFVRGMKGGTKMFFYRLSYALIVAFSVLMIAAGSRLVRFVNLNQEINPATGIPVGFTYLAIPLAGAFIFLHAMKHLIDLFRGTYEIRDLEAEAAEELEAGG